MTSLPGPIVRADWLAAHLAEVQIADVRWYLDGRSGRAAYEGGHVPGAVWVDLDQDLAAPPSAAGGRHPLPDLSEFAAALRRVGLSPDRPVIAYDDAAGSIAARLWWMLRAAGQPVAVLDGGIGSWPGPLEVGGGRPGPRPAVASGPVASGPVASGPLGGDSVPGEAMSDRWHSAPVASTEDVSRQVRDPGVVLLDARSAARYQGLGDAIDARSGHIPGARNHPWTANIDDDGRFLVQGGLRERFAALGVTDATQVIASCGSGVTACHTLLALEVAGLPGGVLYPGSWSAWAADPDRPAATGAAPG